MTTEKQIDHDAEADLERRRVENRTAIQRWDSGDSLWSVEMGGLGPGYEQAIQILIVELVRDSIDGGFPDVEKLEAEDKAAGIDLHDYSKSATQKAWSAWGGATIHRIDDECLGFSGAQVGVAKSVAYKILRDGWSKAMASAPEDRKIQIQKQSPGLGMRTIPEGHLRGSGAISPG